PASARQRLPDPPRLYRGRPRADLRDRGCRLLCHPLAAAHRSRFGPASSPATDCALERWREANPDLAARLQGGQEDLTAWFNELLRLVYRLIFLMVAEDRELLHPPDARPEARQLYAAGYSLGALRRLSLRGAAWDRHGDRYEGLKVVFRALSRGEPALGLPALGGLFAPDALPTLERARLSNRALLGALYHLGWLRERSGLVPVNWRAMETEELGSVYESLLELAPQLSGEGRELVFAAEAAEQRGNQRKTTGSYYTPASLVEALLDSALNPVLERRLAEAEDPEA